MLKAILLVFLIINFQTVTAQEDSLQSPKSTTMGNSTVLGLRTAGYMVGDLDKAKAWYTATFNTEPYFEEPFYVGFNIGGYELGLMPEENPSTEKIESVLTYWELKILIRLLIIL